ncbi:PREDICTED: uncharacterized protein LOC105555998 [Vollenhovia emeryi]|uniref:uncharacterized protein LOC105555998 n=1 Tax=Vollenhovia emeryi TaxID=411798 RepID=UPI0005F4DEC2|nr:PREDICTED: uncharacterized protein LOC105555998 [Vollenhovia emeryi]
MYHGAVRQTAMRRSPSLRCITVQFAQSAMRRSPILRCITVQFAQSAMRRIQVCDGNVTAVRSVTFPCSIVYPTGLRPRRKYPTYRVLLSALLYHSNLRFNTPCGHGHAYDV